MELNGYKKRLIDKKVQEYLNTFGAVAIEGPKWCGKTWTSLKHSASVCYIADPKGNFQNRTLAALDPSLVLDGNKPRLIDEWQEVPSLWDAVRFKVDQIGEKGVFILTGSATPNHKGILHSGTGRFGILRMRTMSLYETGDSCGCVSLESIFNTKIKTQKVKEATLNELIYYCIRGGWPAVIGQKEEVASEVAKSYLKAVITDDMFQVDGVKRDARKVRSLIYSLARNESTIVSNNTLKRDMESYDKEQIDKNTLSDYLSIFNRLFLLEDQEAFNIKLRSSKRILNSPKRHFSDVSLAVAALSATSKMLYDDLNTFGFLFEALCEHDLRIYAENIGGKLYHLRDNRGNEADAIIELPDGRWAAIEIKLGANQIDAAAKELLTIKKIMKDEGHEPSALCVICGIVGAAYTREDSVHVVPLTALC